MAENLLQFEWALTIFGNLDILLRDRPDVFVAMDISWHPAEDKPKRRTVPDVSVVFGRPKGRRGSYKQWEEANVPLTVVIEVPSPGERRLSMGLRKLRFYQRYGVEEYYSVDPINRVVDAWHRTDQRLRPQRTGVGLVSPRLGVRFDCPKWGDMTLTLPDGKPFLSCSEIMQQRSEQETADTPTVLEAEPRALGVDPDGV